MMTFLRSQSQTVLVIVLAVIALGFVFYGNAGNLLVNADGHTTNDFGRIDGESLSVAQLSEAIRNTHNQLVIAGQAEELNQPGAREGVAEEAWRQLLLLHEADRLHINVSDQQLVDYIRGLTIFQKNGVFSPEVYQTQMASLQNGFRISPENFEAALRNTLRINAVSAALFATVRAPSGDMSTQYEKFYGPAEVSVVSFDPKSYADAAQVTPQEIEAEYKAHPDNPAYRTKEKRKVDYVLLELTPDQAKLADKDKAAAKEALGDKALEFALAFQPDPSATTSASSATVDFMAEAKKRGFTPISSDFFTVDTPPANVPPSPSFNNAAFSLTKENPVSKVIPLDNGVVVLHLADVQPSEPQSLDAVKDGIMKQLQQAKGSQAAGLAAQSASQALQAAVAKGTDFKTAAAALNLKVETVPSFVPIKTSQTDVRLQTIAYTSSEMAPGQVKGPIPVQSDNTFLVIHLDNRAKAAATDLADFEKRFGGRQNEEVRAQVYVDWANWAGKRPGTHKPPDLAAFSGVE